MKRILFVDDEPMVLAGLQRSLRPLRAEWITEFASSGAEALQILERQNFDAVVSDMRMPGMDGAELLDEVRKRSPQTVRFVLSGQSDRETVLRSISPAHQYLAKPCDTEELKAKLNQAFALKEMLNNSELRATVSQLKTIPSLPVLYSQIMEELNSNEASLARVGQIISQDTGMTAKILQVVNSAFFGLRCNVSSARHAVDLLGLDIVRAIVLSVHVFSQFETRTFSPEELNWLRSHCLSSGNYAKRIAAAEGAPKHVADDAFTAGIVHDTGKLVFASVAGEKYRQAISLAAEQKITLCEAEREVFGCTHSQLGAYLLGVWGLPGPIVEAVAWHHNPSESPSSGFSTVAAVHAACIYSSEKDPSSLQDGMPLDTAFLHKIGRVERELEWKKICLESADRSTTNGV